MRLKRIYAVIATLLIIAMPPSQANDETYEKSKADGAQAMKDRHYDQAVSLYKDALKRAEQFGRNDVRVADILMSLADAETWAATAPVDNGTKWGAYGNPFTAIFAIRRINAEKERRVRRAYEIYRANKSPAAADAAWDLATSIQTDEASGPPFSPLGKGAVEMMKEAVKLKRQSAGPADRSASAWVTNIGDALNQAHRYDESEAYLKEELSDSQAKLPEKDPVILDRLNNLGSLYLQRGDWEKAAENFRLMHQRLGMDVPLKWWMGASGFAKLGEHFEQQGDIDRAMDFYGDAFRTLNWDMMSAEDLHQQANHVKSYCAFLRQHDQAAEAEKIENSLQNALATWARLGR